MGPLELSLAAAALLIGATGTFSPCGLSVVETIGPTGHNGGRRTTVAACIAFLPGAVIGGLATFGALAALGGLVHGAGGQAAYLVAAALAAIAAVLEAKGVRVVPQIRRQVPEHWRRVMPMPLASALYGVLLGLGFTTFVLSFGVWALAGISLAIGDPALGLWVGACFGLGRAIPIVALAPLAGSPRGTRANELMCEHPGVYRGLRRGDAAVLAAAALALVVVPGSAGARSTAAGEPPIPRRPLTPSRSNGSAAPRFCGAAERTLRLAAATRRSGAASSRRSTATGSACSTASRSAKSRGSPLLGPTPSGSRAAGSPIARRSAAVATGSSPATSPTRPPRAPCRRSLRWAAEDASVLPGSTAPA